MFDGVETAKGGAFTGQIVAYMNVDIRRVERIFCVLKVDAVEAATSEHHDTVWRKLMNVVEIHIDPFLELWMQEVKDSPVTET
jgi:hypothetical protein